MTFEAGRRVIRFSTATCTVYGVFLTSQHSHCYKHDLFRLATRKEKTGAAPLEIRDGPLFLFLHSTAKVTLLQSPRQIPGSDVEVSATLEPSRALRQFLRSAYPRLSSLRRQPCIMLDLNWSPAPGLLQERQDAGDVVAHAQNRSD